LVHDTVTGADAGLGGGSPLSEEDKPKLSVDILYPSGETMIITLHQNEQRKLPANVNIDILMTIRWTNKHFEEFIDK
jgi:hypothetical protein